VEGSSQLPGIFKKRTQFIYKSCMKKELRLLPLTISICLLSSQYLQSQSIIPGIIKDPNGNALQFANVLLLKSIDSSLIREVISDESGKYSFEDIKNGKYLLAAILWERTRCLAKYLKLPKAKKK